MSDALALEKMVKFRVRDLDAMPFVFRKLMAILNKPYPSARELGQVIATDQSLSVRVLRMVNSAAGGVRNNVLSVPHAVSLLGINVVRSLSFCMASYDSFFSSKDQSRRELWKHSILCGLVCRHLSLRLRVGLPEEMFVAGMLHDVGRSVLSKHCPKKSLILEQTYLQISNPLEAEIKALGVTHAEVGSWACECWKLPEVLRSCVRYHHNPMAAGEFTLQAQLVHVADAWALQCVDPSDPELELFLPDCLDNLKLSQEMVQEACDEAMAHFQEIENFLSGENVTRAS